MATGPLLDQVGEYHGAALEAGAPELATAFDIEQAALRDAYDTRLFAERQLFRKQAIVVRTERALEEALAQVEGMLLLFVRKNRKQDPYATAFPGNLGDAVKPKGRAQVAEASRIVDTLQQAADLSDAVFGELQKLAALVPTLSQALDNEEAAEKAVTDAKTLEQQRRRTWRTQYQKDHGALQVKFPGDKRTVETFFYSVRKAATQKKSKTLS